jgi:hypothetical protein
MIVASLLLILVAVTLLVLGLTGGSSGLLISSIVASLLAAVTLVIGARQAAGLRRSRADQPGTLESDPPERSFAESDLRGSEQLEGEESQSAPTGDAPFVTQSISEPVDEPVDEAVPADDEPEPQIVTPTEAVRVAQLDAEVLVVDGRPRYHLADCPFLAGRDPEPIGVNEAVELGFSPCGICRPVDRLAATFARR